LEKINWPEVDFLKSYETVDEDVLELKKDQVFVVKMEQTGIQWNRYSYFLKLKRVVPRIRRASTKLKSFTLSVDELNCAEIIIRLCQAEIF
jgi:hypothetical protein